MRVRGEERGRRLRAVERKPRGAVADHRVAGLREDGDPLRRLREVEPGASSSEPSLNKDRAGPSGRKSAAAKRRIRSIGSSSQCGGVDGGADLEQVAEDDQVVDGAPLVVTAVRENLVGHLSPEQGETAVEKPPLVRERGAAEDERARVANQMVPQHALLHVPLEALQAGRRMLSTTLPDASSGASDRAAIQLPTRVESGYGCHGSPRRGGFAAIQASRVRGAPGSSAPRLAPSRGHPRRSGGGTAQALDSGAGERTVLERGRAPELDRARSAARTAAARP